MKEQLISIDTARLARDLGYEIKGNMACFYTKNPDGLVLPTQSLLQKWLREDYYMIVMPITDFVAWEVIVKHPDKDQLIFDKIHGCLIDTYEDALELGLQEALKILTPNH